FGGQVGGARYASLTDAGPLAVARSDGLPNLAALAYAWPQSAAAGLRALVECGRLAYAGWPLFPCEPELALAFRRMASRPYPLDQDPQGCGRCSPGPVRRSSEHGTTPGSSRSPPRSSPSARSPAPASPARC